MFYLSGSLSLSHRGLSGERVAADQLGEAHHSIDVTRQSSPQQLHCTKTTVSTDAGTFDFGFALVIDIGTIVANIKFVWRCVMGAGIINGKNSTGVVVQSGRCGRFVTLLLLLLMSVLIASDEEPVWKPGPQVDNDFTMPDSPEIEPLIDESLPEPVMPPEELSVINNSAEPLTVPTLHQGFSQIVESEQAVTQHLIPVQIKPTFKALPRYPAAAIRREIAGYVDVDFSLTLSGLPVDIQIVAANPEGVFERSALKAVVDWRYDASIAEELKGQRITERITYVIGEQ